MDNSSVGVLVQHVLVFFLIVVTPLWDWYEIPRLKASTEPRKKVRFYRKILAASWACAIVAVLTVLSLSLVFAERAMAAHSIFALSTPDASDNASSAVRSRTLRVSIASR